MRRIARSAGAVIRKAANIHGSKNNPAFTVEMFLQRYPQFTDVVAEATIQDFIDLANSMVSYDLYGESWYRAMSLAVAHLITLNLMTYDENPSVNSIVSKAKQSLGILTSKSVDGVSASYDTSYMETLNSWGTWNLTIYGQMFIMLAKFMGKAGMYVW